jgi:hypothetical protein
VRANVLMRMFVTQMCEVGAELSLLQLQSLNVGDMPF